MEPDNGADVGLSLREYLQILRRRRGVILQTFLLIGVVATIIAFVTRPVYEASARLLVDPPAANLNTVDASNPISQILALTQPQTVETQAEALRSPRVTDQVTKDVGLTEMKVDVVNSTNVILVTARSNDPKQASAAANDLLAVYLAEEEDRNQGAIKEANSFATRQKAAARSRVLKLENAIMTFQRTHRGTSRGDDHDSPSAPTPTVNPAEEHSASLTGDLEKAQTDLAAVRQEIAADQRQRVAEPLAVTARSLTTNPAIGTLQARIADLNLQRTSLLQPGRFTPESHPVQALNAQIRALQQQLAAQPPLTAQETVTANAQRDTLRVRVHDLQAQEAALEARVSVLREKLVVANGQAGRAVTSQIKLSRLLRAHDDAVEQEKMYSDKQADLALRLQAYQPSAFVDAPAETPTTPVEPKKARSIAFGCLIGLFLGLCLALLQEYVDDRLNSVDDATRALGLPSLGFMPTLTEADARLLPQMKAHDPASESYRVLRTNIHFASVDTPLRTLAVTSTNPSEGKTTTAANLAFAMALDGKRVILVDTDLRRPALHKLLSLSMVPGVTDVLLGHTPLEEALRVTPDLPLLSVLPAGSLPPNPSELLNSRTFRNLIDELSDRADIVIFDTPPVLVAADSAILASHMDGTILVVQTNQTKKAGSRHALRLLEQARSRVLGIAFNKMRGQEGGEYYHYQYEYRYATPPPEAGALPGATPPEAGALPSDADADRETWAERPAERRRNAPEARVSANGTGGHATHTDTTRSEDA